LPFILIVFYSCHFCGRKITENLADIEIYFGLFLFLSIKSCNFAQKLPFRDADGQK